MSFVEMTSEEWQAVYQHHDALIHMAELELKADAIRETCPEASQQQLLQPLEIQIHQLDDAIATLSA